MKTKKAKKVSPELIKAAPELLRLVEQSLYPFQTDKAWDWYFERAKAAIKKAKGL